MVAGIPFTMTQNPEDLSKHKTAEIINKVENFMLTDCRVRISVAGNKRGITRINIF